MSNESFSIFNFDVDVGVGVGSNVTSFVVDCGNATADPDTGICPLESSGTDDVVAVSNLTCGKQEYFSSTYAVVGTSVQGIIFLVGVLGNVLVCCVVSKSRFETLARRCQHCSRITSAESSSVNLLEWSPEDLYGY